VTCIISDWINGLWLLRHILGRSTAWL